jgi:hypothetical protein
MNKLISRIILVFFLFVAISLSSGCEQLTPNSLPSSAVTTITPTNFRIFSSASPSPPASITPLSCFSGPQAPTTELEIVAETWFLSSVPQIPDRGQYIVIEADEQWGIICNGYQHVIQTNEEIAYNPIDISLYLITQSISRNYFGINNVSVAAVNSDDILASRVTPASSGKSRNISTVVVVALDVGTQFESRADYVFEEGIWQLRWLGYRWKCLDDVGSVWNNTVGNIECP